MTDQAEQLRMKVANFSTPNSNAAERNRVIAVASGKGGVGKSNFCLNFALGLQQAGRRPIVIDADVGFANIEVLLGVQPSRTIYDVFEGRDIWEVVETSPVGLPFLSAGNGLLDIHSLSPAHMDRLISQMGKLHQKYDVVILDSGAGLSSNISRLVASADDLILVTTPEPTAMTDAYALTKLLLARESLPPTQLVVNRISRIVEGRLAAEKLRLVADRFLNVKLGVLGYILEDTAVPNAVMEQQAFLTKYPKSPSARCVNQLVQNFLKVEGKSVGRGMIGFLDRLFHRFRTGGEVDSGHPA